MAIDRRRHAETVFDARQGGLMRAHQALPAPHQPRADAPGIELIERELEGALGAIQSHHRGIVGDTGKG